MTRLEYRGKMILAPMVIDIRLLASERVENKLLGTINYIDRRDNILVFRTCSKEKDKLVLQIGTADEDRAAAAAKKVEKDISGFDVYMGCPKGFSLKGGMRQHF